MNPSPTVWRCAICEAVNSGTTTCGACGAEMTRGSRAVNDARARIWPMLPPPPPPDELPMPVQRAINREPVDEEEWTFEDQDFKVIPVPGGCIMVGTPRRRDPRR